nr:unnamed protein product [Callosobruchus chinensis]
MRPFPYRQSRRDAQKETFNTRLSQSKKSSRKRGLLF